MTKDTHEMGKVPSQHPKSTGAPWGASSSIAALLASVVAIYIFLSFGAFGVEYSLSSQTDLPPSPLLHQTPSFESIKGSRSQEAEDLLIESLNLLQSLLVKISEDVDADDDAETGASSTDISVKRSRLQSRGLLSEFQNLFSGLTSGIGDSVSGASLYLGAGLGNGTVTGLKLDPKYLQSSKNVLPPATGAQSVAQNLGQGLTSTLIGSLNVSSIASMGGGVALPASKALASGLGSGAASGLNLKAFDNKTFNSTDISGIAGSFGQGLSANFIGGVDLKKMVASMAPTLTPEQTNAAALAFAQGLGSGAASAANLSSKPATNASFNTDGIPGIAGSVGQGLSTSFIEGIDVQKMLSMVKPSTPLTMAQVNRAALSFAQGIGGGAAFATKLTAVPPSNNDTDPVAGLAGNFGQGLSVSFLQNIDIKAMASSATPMISRQQVIEAVQGFGTGLAGGAVVGIGLQPADSMPTVDNGGIGPITDTFARGLTQSFLANGTATKALALLTQGQQAPQVNMGAIAKGFAFGLVDGAQTSIDNAGGIAKIFKMSDETAATMMSFPAPRADFDDSVGGAAFGFGNGLALEAVKGGLQVFGKPPIKDTAPEPVASPATTAPGIEAPGAAPAAAPAAAAAVDSTKTPGAQTGVTRRTKRQAEVMAPVTEPTLINATAPIDFRLDEIQSSINPILQQGVDILGCQGIGGLIAIGISIQLNTNATGKLVKDPAQAADTVKKLSFLNQTLIIHDKSGNTVEINPAKLLLKINGNPVIKEAIVLTLHIVIGIVAFAVIIPIILMVNSIHNFAIMTGRTNVLKKYSKIQWGLAVGVLLPSMLLILILGVVSEGARSHFYTTHGVVGLLLLLLTFAAFPLAYLRNQSSAVKTAFKINLGLIIQFIFIEILSGFNDLSTLTFCALQFLPDFIFILLGFILATPILQAVSLLLLELLFGRWRRNVPEKSFPDEKNSVYSLPAGSTGPTGSYMNI